MQRGSTRVVLPRSLRVDGWLRRAYQWGLRHGVSHEPPLILALLADQDGDALALRYMQTLQTTGPFQLAPDRLRELLAQGLPTDRAVALAEATTAAAPLARRILVRPRMQPVRPRRGRLPIVEYTLDQRRRFVAELAARLAEYVYATSKPEIVPLFLQFVAAMLDLGPLTSDLAEMIDRVLHHGLKDLRAPLQYAYLDLLVEQHGRFWDRSQLPPNTQRIAGWLEARWTEQIPLVLELLGASGDAAIVREALELDIVRLLVGYRLGDTVTYRWLLALLHTLDPRTAIAGSTAVCEHGSRDMWRLARVLCTIIDRFPTPQGARAALQPVVDGLIGLPAERRAEFLTDLLGELEDQALALHELLPRLMRYLPAAIDFCLRSGDSSRCWAPLATLVTLDRADPDAAPGWYRRMLAELLALDARSEDQPVYDSSIGLAASIAVALAEGQLSRFQPIFRAAMRPFGQPRETLDRGIALLDRLPALRAALAQNFAQQPQRCAALLARVGLAMRLGSDALAPLAELESPLSAAFLLVDAHDTGRGWADLLELAPDLAATGAAYLHAQWLLGESLDLPAGVRRILEQPHKLARELAFLEEKVMRQPERADLAARCTSLRQRLADQGRLLDGVRDEAQERMAQATAQALLAAAEQQALECYRRRLVGLVGTLPNDLKLDDDLLNATLLTLDVRLNRRLLLRLLRAHVAGEHGWRQQHPANSAFLQALAGRGCDSAAWLGTMPRVYRCAGVAGGRVRLHLERDPLRILQMGNVMDTCLSFGGINSFSTVANACELNKRVIFATDANGHIVGRKLIAVSEEWKLVGFHTYSSLGDAAANTMLRAVFQRYAADFAARCRLELAEQGTVARLLAEAWYDDGVVAWAEEDGEKRASSAPRTMAKAHAR
jgi:hypothetical protein